MLSANTAVTLHTGMGCAVPDQHQPRIVIAEASPVLLHIKRQFCKHNVVMERMRENPFVWIR